MKKKRAITDVNEEITASEYGSRIISIIRGSFAPLVIEIILLPYSDAVISSFTSVIALFFFISVPPFKQRSGLISEVQVSGGVRAEGKKDAVTKHGISEKLHGFRLRHNKYAAAGSGMQSGKAGCSP